VIIGAGLGLAGGYLWDHFLGDSDYTAREALVDTVGGALGGSLLKPIVKGTTQLGKGLWRFKRGGGAISQIGKAEAVETVGYVYGGQLLLQTPKYVVGTGAAIGTGYAYDYFKSSESSSESYQQNGGSEGDQPSRRFDNIDAIPAGSRVTKPTWKTTKTDYIGNPSKGYHYCKKGWLLVRVGDTNMCWQPPGKKKS
jgi:hypothetical protein